MDKQKQDEVRYQKINTKEMHSWATKDDDRARKLCKESINLVRDLMIGALCGVIIVLCVIGIVKFIAKIKRKQKLRSPPACGDDNPNDFYMNIQTPNRTAEDINVGNVRPNPDGSTNEENNLIIPFCVLQVVLFDKQVATLKQQCKPTACCTHYDARSAHALSNSLTAYQGSIGASHSMRLYVAQVHGGERQRLKEHGEVCTGAADKLCFQICRADKDNPKEVGYVIKCQDWRQTGNNDKQTEGQGRSQTNRAVDLEPRSTVEQSRTRDSDITEYRDNQKMTKICGGKDIGCNGDISDYTITVKAVTVQEGLCVTVPCTFTIDRNKRLTQAVGYWGYYEGKSCTLGSCYVVSSNESVSLSYRKENFHMTGNVNNRDCSLTINDAKKQDNGTYYFRIEDGVDGVLKWNYKDSYLDVNVKDLTEKPQIILPEKLVAGNEVTLTCKPPDTGNCSGTATEIRWGRLEKEDRTKSDPLIICGEKRTRISQCKESTITFTLSQNDHQTAITCNVTFPAVGNSTQTSVTLDVQYPPFISDKSSEAFYDNRPLVVKEGDNVTLRCSVDSNPPANVTWWRGKEKKTKHNILTITNISRQYTDTYDCVASNEHGNASTAVTIAVLYPPTITTQISVENQVSNVSYVTVKEGSSVILRCSVDSNPPANMTIMKAADTFASIISGRELILHLRNISQRETGIYNISAKNEHGTSYSIINISIPDSSNAATQTASEGKKSNNLVRDMMIGLLCGMFIALCVIGIVKLIAKIKRKQKLNSPPASRDDLYMNVHPSLQPPNRTAEDINVRNIRPDPDGSTKEENIHYARIFFSKTSPRPNQDNSEPEYAEVKPK
ncbi:sialic acid-binding Ig-like lectin 16 [Pelobates fuscus]|uniref:sialic acid-binding Ig-like lectin 16 n=1 Tax=Pelobates fuscus TaxID=191477 RepID=UPI002FE47E12